MAKASWMDEYRGKRVSEVSDTALMDIFEYVVQRNHYDPIDSVEPPFEYDELRAELQARLSRKCCRSC